MKTWTLEKINKYLLLLALASLVFKKSSFAATHIPNPFEIIFGLVLVLTLIHLIVNKKIKEFCLSIPKKTWIVLFCLIFSVILGWAITIFLKDLKPNFNNLLEFGGFAIGIALFVTVLFYARNDELYIKKCLYVLLVPTIYTLFVIHPPLAQHLNLATDITFLGLTISPSIISKILLVPAIFFVTLSLFEMKNVWRKSGYFLIASAMVALIIWTGSRGALVSMVFAILLVGTIFVVHQFRVQKIFVGLGLIVGIIICGYFMAPKYAKFGFIARNFSEFKIGVAKNLILGKPIPQFTHDGIPLVPETRLTIWPIYFEHTLKNPLGHGPNTHMGITSSNGKYLELGPHNSYLTIWFWGGLLGLISFFYLLFLAFKNLKIKLEKNFDPIDVAILGILAAVAMSIAFNDSLQFFWFWVILSLASRK